MINAQNGAQRDQFLAHQAVRAAPFALLTPHLPAWTR
jgi:hypothetical protein